MAAPRPAGDISSKRDDAGWPFKMHRNHGAHAMTWSILARDPLTGTLGAAVATRFFAVGALAIHVEGGVAALATQALINPMYAVQGMPRLRAGETPDGVIEAL